MKFTQTFTKDLLVLTAVLSMLSACSHNASPGKTDTTAANKGATAETRAPEAAGKTEQASKPSGDEKKEEKTDDKAGAAAKAGAGKVSINLMDLPSDVPICSVAGTEIKVGDYKRMLHITQVQSNQSIVADPSTRSRLLEEAKRRNITLSSEEKTKLLHAAHQQKGQDPKQFQEFLKQAKATEKQFDDEVLQTGLAFKTSNMIIEETLLFDLVNRSLLAQAAQEAGGEKEALNKYQTFKHSRQYDALVQQTGLSADALKEEMVRAELAKIQLNKLEAQAKISDADLRKLYDSHKKELKHEARIKLSTILVACPENDVGPISSVSKQVMRANPKLTTKELDATVAQIMEQSKQKALICLGQARGGADFAKLANENSNDPVTQMKKTGGDLGYLEKKDLIPALADAVWNLKAGQVLPQIVKSELGYNIYKVIAKQPAGEFKYEEVKPKLEVLAKQSKLQQAIAQWLDHRRKIVRIEYTPKFLAIANNSAKTAPEKK